MRMKDKKELREELANFIHEVWAHWTGYMLGEICTDVPPKVAEFVQETSCVKRWHGQIETPYAELSEKEKDSDRVFANTLLNLLEKRGK